jgi:hypothetical protein
MRSPRSTPSATNSTLRGQPGAAAVILSELAVADLVERVGRSLHYRIPHWPVIDRGSGELARSAFLDFLDGHQSHRSGMTFPASMSPVRTSTLLSSIMSATARCRPAGAMSDHRRRPIHVSTTRSSARALVSWRSSAASVPKTSAKEGAGKPWVAEKLERRAGVHHVAVECATLPLSPLGVGRLTTMPGHANDVQTQP